MAIPFLNNINLDDNQLLNAKLHVTSSAPTAAAGQIYFDSTTNVTTAKYYDGSAWIDLVDHTFNNGTYINLTEAGTDATRTLTADLSAVDGTAGVGERYLTKNNTWATVASIPGTYTFDVGSNSGADQTVDSGDVLEISGGDYITGTVSKLSTTVTTRLDHDSTSRTDTTSTDAPGYGGTFEAVTSVTTNGTGHVTAIDVSTVTIPASDNTDNYVDSISFNTGSGILTLGRTGALADLTQDLDGRYLELDGGTMTGDINMGTNQITNLPDPTNAQDAATKAYVDAATVGGLVYQGGYDANLNSPDLTTSPNSIEKGWTYTVTADGTFFGEQLRVGDVLIAEVNSPSSLADWTTVQNNIDLASLTQVGIGNVNSDTNDTKLGISVGYSSGTASVGLDIDGLTLDQLQEGPNDYTIPVFNEADAINRKADLNDIAIFINGSTSFSGTIGDGASTSLTVSSGTHGLGTDSSSFMIQLVEVSSGETVYADVTRGASGLVTIDFAVAPALNAIRVLIQKIG